MNGDSFIHGEIADIFISTKPSLSPAEMLEVEIFLRDKHRIFLQTPSQAFTIWTQL